MLAVAVSDAFAVTGMELGIGDAVEAAGSGGNEAAGEITAAGALAAGPVDCGTVSATSGVAVAGGRGCGDSAATKGSGRGAGGAVVTTVAPGCVARTGAATTSLPAETSPAGVGATAVVSGTGAMVAKADADEATDAIPGIVVATIATLGISDDGARVTVALDAPLPARLIPPAKTELAKSVDC